MSNVSYLVCSCRIWATTARRSARESNSLAAAERPTGPEHFLEVQAALRAASFPGAPGKRGADLAGDRGDMARFARLTHRSRPHSLSLADIRVGRAFFLRPTDRLRRRQYPLPLVPPAAVRPLKDHGPQGGVFRRAPRQRRVPPGQVLEVPEISAVEAKRFLLFDANQVAVKERLLALGALPFVTRDEYGDLARTFGFSRRIRELRPLARLIAWNRHSHKFQRNASISRPQSFNDSSAPAPQET